MELVQGKPLAARLAKRVPRPLDETLAIAHEVLEALIEAHTHGVVHRDIKAENILLTRKGVKVADFGIAKTPGYEKRILEGKVLGSVDTISPEQAAGREVDGRADLYSLGVVLYQMATGHLPFEGDDPETVAFLHINEPPKYPSTINPHIARGLEQIILCALEKDPNKRFPDAAAMLAAIRRLERDPYHVFRRFGPAIRSPFTFLSRRAAIASVSLGVAAALLCGLFFFVFRGEEIVPTPVTVISLPSYVEGVWPDVEEEIRAIDSRIKITITCVLRPELPEGTILTQMPEAGALFKLDGEDDRAEVVLVISTQKGNNPGLPPSIFG
jgi:serine/threonine-protein kinase